MKHDLAFLDVETTGFHFGGTDRIVEIALLRTTSDGRVLDEFTTLVNPQRDVGCTRIHGISGKEAANAPIFSAIAGDVIRMLRGAVPVGHNAPFDLRFLEAAFDRNGTPVTLPTYLCTLQLANDLPRVPSRRLGDLCVWYGIRLNHAHSAYADALATRELFFHLLPDVGGWSAVAPVLDEYSVQAGQFRWPDLRASGVSYTRADASRDAIRNCSYLASLVSRLPSQPSSRKLASGYLALLDRVLEDRRVEPREAEALVSLAGELGLSPGDVGTAHDDYLVSLVAAALADGVVSKGELEDLSSVAELLGIHRARLDEMIASEERVRKNGCSLRTPAIPPVNLRGKSVCFTGEFTCTISGRVPSREEVEAMASAAGLVVKSGVSKKLDVLVTADPFSLSGKARKAREYGTRILAEAAFWHAIDVRVE